MQHLPSTIRLDHFLVTYSRHSRRAIYSLLNQRAIYLNNVRCDTLTQFIDPRTDTVRINQTLITPSVERVVYAYHKPTGIITTINDPQERPCLNPIIDRIPEPVFPVGRLDKDTSGLLLLTNYGQLANYILHPRYKLSKTYQVTLPHVLTDAVCQRLRSGFFLNDGPVAVDSIEWLHGQTYQVVISQGRNRIIRRMFDFFNMPVQVLHRTAIGPIQLHSLTIGSVKRLDTPTLKLLYKTLRFNDSEYSPSN